MLLHPCYSPQDCGRNAGVGNEEGAAVTVRMSDTELGWLAGLFEGEGCTGIYVRGVRAYIAMTDEDVLLRVQRLFPSPQGIKVRERGHGRYKPLYEWRIGERKAVAEFLSLILPLLGERRSERARQVIARATDGGGLGSGHRRKTHCRNGHPYDERNTRLDRHGYRLCRICRRSQRQAQRQRQEQLAA